MAGRRNLRNLVVVLGDQLNDDSAALKGFDKERDSIWMAETDGEAKHVWSTKQRIAVFLCAMRRFRERMRERGFVVGYQEAGDKGGGEHLAAALGDAIERLGPERVKLVEPGEWRLKQAISKTVKDSGAELEMLEDETFFCSHDRFAEHAEGRKQLRMEYFYREMRREHDVLVDGDRPEGGKWNYDAANRQSFGKDGPENLAPATKRRHHKLVADTLAYVRKRYADHPGDLDEFPWPTSPQEARYDLSVFVEKRLPLFGKYQDAMWTGEPFLYHSLISMAMNLKLLSPREAVDAAAKAYRDGKAPLEAVEGFVRQILGWREFVRGVYWRFMPDYAERNALGAQRDLPDFYWSGETEMRCMREALGQTLKFGYAHHIQRLMVTGLFGLLYGVDPRKLHQWYLAVYVDAVEWVELPNTLGMSQYGDGGIMASKPYVATGKYIDRMSDYCANCRYRPSEGSGEKACPFTALYWDFLRRHADDLRGNNRMAMQLRNLDRKSEKERKSIAKEADRIRRAAREGRL